MQIAIRGRRSRFGTGPAKPGKLLVFSMSTACYRRTSGRNAFSLRLMGRHATSGSGGATGIAHNFRFPSRKAASAATRHKGRRMNSEAGGPNGS
jgi:hypothetical protein